MLEFLQTPAGNVLIGLSIALILPALFVRGMKARTLKEESARTDALTWGQLRKAGEGLPNDALVRICDGNRSIKGYWATAATHQNHHHSGSNYVAESQIGFYDPEPTKLPAPVLVITVEDDFAPDAGDA